MEEAEKKRQEMMKAQKEKMGPAGGGKSKNKDSGMGNVADVRREMTKTKEQLEEEKKISLSIRIRPLELDGENNICELIKCTNKCLDMDTDSLKSKAKELWDLIVKLETERYDLEEKVRRQDYDVDIIHKLSQISSKMQFSSSKN